MYNFAMLKNKNFKLKRREKIKDFGFELFEFEHKSGATVFYFKNSDKEKMFAVSFVTLPNSDKGEPHILEHSLFVGSENFDLGGKEPFAELARKRMASYLNAYTMPEHTIFPVASINEDDFYYMMRIYLDALFAPNFLKDENIFRQEAWRVEKDKEGNYRFSGVVLGEMKSRLSSPQAIFFRQLFHKQFPNSHYEHESGGDPNEIVELSHKEFKDFYKKHYTAKNARIYLYGKQNLEKTFALLDEYLQKAPKGRKLKPSAKAPKEKRLEKITLPGKGDTDSAIAISFYGKPANKLKDNLILSIIFNVLTQDKSSPLRKAFDESKIKALPVFEHEPHTKINTFNFIFFNTKKKDLPKLEKLVFEVLQKIKKEGLDKKRLQKELDKTELFFEKMRFIKDKSEATLGFIEKFWVYDSDLFEAFSIKKILQEIEKEFKKNPEFFDKYFAKYFADAKNPLVLRAEAKNIDVFEKLHKKERALNRASKKEKEEFERQIKSFAEFKEKEGLSEITPSNLKKYRTSQKDWTKEVLKDGGFYFKKINSKLVSAEIFFDLSHLSLEDLQNLAILINSFKSFDFYSMTRKEMDLRQAGVLSGPSFSLTHFAKGSKAKSFLKLSFVFLQKNKKQVKEILSEYLHNLKIDEKILAKDLQEFFDSQKDSLRYFSSAKVFATKRALAPLGLSFALQELTGGISFIDRLAKLNKKLDPEDFEELYKKVFTGKRKIALTAKDFDKDFFDFLPKAERVKKQEWKNPFKKESIYFYIPHKSFYTNALASSAALAAPSFALSSLLGLKYFWEKIREKGGAYGATLSLDLLREVFVLASYSDPHQKRTYEIFKSLDGFDLASFDASDKEGAKAANLLRFDKSPNELTKASECFVLDAQGISFDFLQKQKLYLLQAQDKEIEKELKKIKGALLKGVIKVSLGGKTKPESDFDQIVALKF